MTEKDLTQGTEDDVIEIVEDLEVDILVDGDGNAVGAVVDDLVVATGPGGSIVDETVDVLDADGDLVLEEESIQVYDADGNLVAESEQITAIE